MKYLLVPGSSRRPVHISPQLRSGGPQTNLIRLSLPLAAEPLPVMLWLHGGSAVVGSAYDPLPRAQPGLFYDGQSLAERGVVVVTINYRLGIFGLFAHTGLGSGDSAPRNQALYDQRQALLWVQQNIASFGGDPTRVTLFGQSAGAEYTCLHVASPLSRGLFQRAISQSGSCVRHQRTLAEAQREATALASALGCRGPAAIDCMRAKTAQDLIQPAVSEQLYGATVDGVFLPDQPRALFESGAITNVPYIIGSTYDEGTLFRDPMRPVETPEQLQRVVREDFGSFAREILAQYPLSSFANSANPLGAALDRIHSDNAICASRALAVRAAEARLPVWMFNFNIPFDSDLGATHGAEIIYVFNSSPMTTPEAIAATTLIQGAWTSFAADGDPSSDALAWPSFSPESDLQVSFALSGPTVVSNFRTQECALWIRVADAAYND